MKYNKFAFDMDGTLVDSHFKLNEGVVNFFYNILTKVDNPKILINSGNSVENALHAFYLIKAELNKKYGSEVADKFKISISGFAGSVVIDENGHTIWNKGISISNYNIINQIISGIDENSFIIARTKEGLAYNKPNLVSKDRVIVELIKMLYNLMGPGNDKTIGLSEQDFIKLFEEKKVRSLEILSLNKMLNKEITRVLSSALNGKLTVSGGMCVQVSCGSKLQSIKQIFGDDLQNVVYVGDGYNDIPPLSMCGKTFALGQKVKVLESADFAVRDFNDINNSIFFDADLSEVSSSIIKNAKKIEEEKKSKMEKGRVIYNIDKIKSKIKSK
ncbi:MAG: HAD hydrolase family protein [Christensenellales bacterium]